MPHRLGLLVFDQLFILRAISVKVDPLGPTGMSLVKFNLPLDQLNTNNQLGEFKLLSGCLANRRSL
jgi:hypothetical protein